MNLDSGNETVRQLFGMDYSDKASASLHESQETGKVLSLVIHVTVVHSEADETVTSSIGIETIILVTFLSSFFR